MKRFSEMSQFRIGISGTVVLALLLTAAVNAGDIKGWFVGDTYSAEFAEAGGLRADDEVHISGTQVGTVQSVELDRRGQVVVTFTSDGPALGRATTAAIKTETALGTKFLKLDPAGGGELRPGAAIPLQRTKSPYDVTEALSDLTTTTGRIDTNQLQQALGTVSRTFANTPPEVRMALDGVKRLSQTIAKRDDALHNLLRNAKGVTSVLSERNAQITRLLTDGNALLDELENRRDTIRELLTGVRQATNQLTAFAKENTGSVGTALTKLQDVLGVLNKNVGKLSEAIQLVGRFGRALSEGLASGPFFYAYLQNLPPTNLAPVLPSLFDGIQPNSGQPDGSGDSQSPGGAGSKQPPGAPGLGQLLPGVDGADGGAQGDGNGSDDGGQQDGGTPTLPLPGSGGE